jgi:thiol-disulfide isomerase/thioredoxin
MTARARTSVRAAVLGGGALVAAAALIRPFHPEPAPRVRGPGMGDLATEPSRTPEGFLAIDGPALLTRIRRSGAKGTVVGAWASWCGSCKEDVPILLGLTKGFGSDIDVALVSVDEPETMAAAAKMLHDFGAKELGYVVTGPLGEFKAAMSPRWPGMLPATFLFDGTGKLRYFWGGPVHEDELVPLLRRYLAGEHIDGEANFGLAPGATSP